MSTTQRPTPETDAAIIAAKGTWTFELKESMQKLERGRDEAREELASCNAFNENEIVQELQTNCLTLTTQNERLIGEREDMREVIKVAHEAIITLMLVKRGGMQAANALIDASIFGRETLKKLQPFLKP